MPWGCAAIHTSAVEVPHGILCPTAERDHRARFLATLPRRPSISGPVPIAEQAVQTSQRDALILDGQGPGSNRKGSTT